MEAIGTDLLEIERLERALERRPRLAQRLFTDAELGLAAARARPGQHLAARFCAKEAVTKALTLDVLRPREIEVLSAPGGAPRVLLSGAAARRAAQLGVAVQVSLTHTRALAGAVALATGAPADAVVAAAAARAGDVVAATEAPPGSPATR